jgi:hypothetical protein
MWTRDVLPARELAGPFATTIVVKSLKSFMIREKPLSNTCKDVSYQRPGSGTSKYSPGGDPHPAVAKQHCPR